MSYTVCELEPGSVFPVDMSGGMPLPCCQLGHALFWSVMAVSVSGLEVDEVRHALQPCGSRLHVGQWLVQYIFQITDCRLHVCRWPISRTCWRREVVTL